MKRRWAASLLLLGALSASASLSARAETGAVPAADPFPELAGLGPNVEFWVRVFSEWRLGQVVVHDLDHPAIVYAVLDLPGPVEERYTEAQRAWVDGVREEWTHYLRGLEHKVAAAEPLDDLDKRWALQFATVVGADKLSGAHARVRTQRGMRERFHGGLVRSGRFEGPIREILRGHGLPEDLAYLPHVESSFQYRAHSSAGAAGIWQFTRGTGRLYLAINSAIDERLDPVAATYGAARYLRDAHAKLGSWPLAVTSYNHGVQGMQRARERFGDDFERIVREYDGRSFGFASKNFYAEFLAARRIARDPASYFPEGVSREPELELDSVVLEERVTPFWLASHYDVPLAELAALNTGWSARAVDDGLRLPQGTRVWLPPGALAAAERRGPRPKFAAPGADGTTHVVRAGETLSGIAAAHGVSQARLRELNAIPAGSSLIRVGQALHLPTDAAAGARPPEHVVQRGETLGRIAARYGVALLDLLAANALSMRSVIHPGQVLLIPH
jgi:membrane-bound lytic murein transglycosylase D